MKILNIPPMDIRIENFQQMKYLQSSTRSSIVACHSSWQLSFDLYIPHRSCITFKIPSNTALADVGCSMKTDHLANVLDTFVEEPLEFEVWSSMDLPVEHQACDFDPPLEHQPPPFDPSKATTPSNELQNARLSNELLRQILVVLQTQGSAIKAPRPRKAQAPRTNKLKTTSSLRLDKVDPVLHQLLRKQYEKLESFIGTSDSPIPSNDLQRFQCNLAKLGQIEMLYKKYDLHNMESHTVNGTCGISSWSQEKDILLALQTLDIQKYFPGACVDIGSGTGITSVVFALLGSVTLGIELDKYRVQKTVTGHMNIMKDLLQGTSKLAAEIRSKKNRSIHPSMFTRLLTMCSDATALDLKNLGVHAARFFSAKAPVQLKNGMNEYDGLLSSKTLRYLIVSGTEEEVTSWGIDTSKLFVAAQGTHRMKGGKLSEMFTIYITPLGVSEISQQIAKPSILASLGMLGCPAGPFLLNLTAHCPDQVQQEYLNYAIDFLIRYPYQRKRPSPHDLAKFATYIADIDDVQVKKRRRKCK